MKRYLGIVCILYSLLIGYVIVFDQLKNFLAPQMQIYIKITFLPMLLIGIVLLVNNKINYKFKVSDLVLLFPIILILVAGDGKLTASFAANRTLEINIDTKEEQVIDKKYDFTNPDFDIIDENYDSLASYITVSPKAVKYEDKTIKVRGFVVSTDFLPSNYYVLGKYLISCCAADATFTGFIIQFDDYDLPNNSWYEIEGVLKSIKDKEDYDIMYIKVINIKEISSAEEEQYVYPCYAYGNGDCNALAKYELEY